MNDFDHASRKEIPLAQKKKQDLQGVEKSKNKRAKSLTK